MHVRLLLFASAREAAGRAHDEVEVVDTATIATVLAAASARYGDEFARVLATARVWCNGDEPAAGVDTPVAAEDEIAVLPPVSGG